MVDVLASVFHMFMHFGRVDSFTQIPFVHRHAIYVQGLSVPFACVGSGDPVRVLRLYTTNTLDTL